MRSNTHLSGILLLLCGLWLPMVSAQDNTNGITPISADALSGVSATPYKLSHKDVVRVSVFEEAELESILPINNKGEIKLPLISTIYIGGLTIEQAAQKIEQAYINGEFLRAPEVTLVVEEYAPRIVSVLGEVNNPGKFQFPKQVTEIDLVELIGQAGGFTDVAASSDVRITRKSKNGEETVFKKNVQKMIDGGSRRDEDTLRFAIKPGDFVYVPERFF